MSLTTIKLADPAPLAPQSGARHVTAKHAVDEHLVSLVSPESFEAEQYRLLRHILEKLHKGPKLRIVAVTSPGVGDGKTTTAINLAGSLAQNPAASVLLVDGDLRRPSVATRLGFSHSSGPGLAGAVARPGYDLGHATGWIPEFNLAVLPAGRCPASVYQTLESPRVGELLGQARARYDYVVIDTPPVLLVPDCRVISQWVDAFILVVRAHHTPRKLVAETLNAMRPTKLLGLVFNGDNRPLYGDYKRHYGYDYGRTDGGRARTAARPRPQPARPSIAATAGFGPR